MDTSSLNSTNPIRLRVEDLTLTVRSDLIFRFYHPGMALAATTDIHQFLDAWSGEVVSHRPRSDADALEELYVFDALPDLDALAEAQGVQPIRNIEDLATDFWPEEESIEDFIAAAMEGRREEDDSDS